MAQETESAGGAAENVPKLDQPPSPLIEKQNQVGTPANTEVIQIDWETTSDQAIRTAKDVEGKLGFLWATHQYVNEYIRFSDTKAGLTVVFVSGVLGTLYTLRVQDSFLRQPIREWTTLSIAGLAAFLFLTCSVVLAGVAIKPRLTKPGDPGFLYWADVAAHKSSLSLWQSFRDESIEELAEHLSNHLFVLSRICESKYYWVNHCILAGIIGSVAAAVSLLIR